MTYKENDFIKIEFDIYANGKLVQTTDKKKADVAKIELNIEGPQTIVLGKQFILKALDDDILQNNLESNSLDLTPVQAYGKRDKNFIKTFPKSAFDEQKLRAVVGMSYDFNGNIGIVKTVVGGRVMVDFNSPLAGKDIKIDYKIVGKVEDLKEKLEFILNTVLGLPKENFEVVINEKNIILKGSSQLKALSSKLKQIFEEFASEVKNYSLEIQNFKKN